MTEKANMALLLDVLFAWNSHDVERMLAFLDEKHVMESDTLPDPVVGHDGFRRYMELYFRAFPDLHFELTQLIPNGRFVAQRWTLTGTHHGDIMGIAPTGRKTKTHGCNVYDIKDSKIMRTWSYWDTGSLLHQLGVLPRAEIDRR